MLTAAATEASQPRPPLQQCLAVNDWSVVMAGVVAPLLVIYRLEQRSRRSFDQEQHRLREWLRQQRRQRQPEEQPGLAADSSAAPAAEPVLEAAGAVADSTPADLQLPLEPLLPLTGYWPVDAYLASSFVWSVVACLH